MPRPALPPEPAEALPHGVDETVDPELVDAWVGDAEADPAEAQVPSLPGIPSALGVVIGLAAILFIIQGISPIREIVAASFLALNLVLVIWPIQRLLAKVLHRVLASIIAGILAIAVLLALLTAIGWAIARLVQALPAYREPFQNMVNQVVEFSERYDIQWDFSTGAIIDTIQRYVNVEWIVSNLTTVLASLGSAVWLIALIIMIMIFMTMDSGSFGDRMTRLAERHNATLAWALNAFARGVRKYWIVASVFGLIVAGADWVLLVALGVPLASVWMVFAFVTNFIPNIGFVLGLIPPTIMAFLDQGPWTALWVIVGYCVLNVVIQVIIQPRVTGEAIGITATVAVLSLLVWAVVLGPLGAILAIPATLFVKTLFIDIDPRSRWVNALIAANPKTSDEDPIKLSELLERAKRLRKAAKKNGHTGK
ncbi:MAG: AI-2E family transporter [Propionibacteriaceae bacterium]|jgi:predicted PurR-regulated permease PerM|nr:AI-2E family transporter [Propionibacteriaceae bacterium]